jgi:hypothetical protein
MPRLRAAVLTFCLTGCAIAGEAAAKADQIIEDGTALDQRLAEDGEAAATYRLARVAIPPTPAMDALARTYLDLARDLIAAGGPPAPDEPARVAAIRAGATYPQEGFFHSTFSGSVYSFDDRADDVAETGFDEAPLSSLAGELLEARLEAAARAGDLVVVADTLERLWQWLPEFNLGRSMRIALTAAERVQSFHAAVDLQAPDPADVVTLTGATDITSAAARIFIFLSRYGDRDEIAPRAALGHARSLLRSIRREDAFAARRAYEDLLAGYPGHPLAFTALLELTLSHMRTYRGDDYDVGALMTSAMLIDQASTEVGDDAERRTLVASYRARISAWHQDRDLAVARWYRSKRLPLGWIGTPIGVDGWQEGARRYYDQVVLRDPVSPQGQAAARERAALPPPAP